MTDAPFTWGGKNLETIGDLIDAINAIDASPTRAQDAAAFMAKYRMANEHADANIRYLLGYFEPPERRTRLRELFSWEEPTAAFTPDPERDAQALDRMNSIFSQPNWSVGMLEDLCAILRSTGRQEIAEEDLPEYHQH